MPMQSWLDQTTPDDSDARRAVALVRQEFIVRRVDLDSPSH